MRYLHMGLFVRRGKRISGVAERCPLLIWCMRGATTRLCSVQMCFNALRLA
jgi:hypothetical protein